jgi:sensor histidine kinase YesM
VPNEGRIEIIGSCEGKDIKFIVKDNGKGMSKENLEKYLNHSLRQKLKEQVLALSYVSR